MFYKVHESYRKVVAIADKELIGKIFEEGNRQLDIRESFYNDKEADEEHMIHLMQQFALDDATFNIVGEKSVQAALKAEIIDSKGIGRIADIPFALVLL